MKYRTKLENYFPSKKLANFSVVKLFYKFSFYKFSLAMLGLRSWVGFVSSFCSLNKFVKNAFLSFTLKSVWGAGGGRLSFGSNHNKILLNAILIGKILRSVMKEKISVNKLLGQYGKILLNYDRIRPVADSNYTNSVPRTKIC